MKHLEGIMLGLSLLAVTGGIGASVAMCQADGPPQGPGNKSPMKVVQATNEDRGQQVFEQNCARCHNAPDGFSSRISGSVAMHMRVRANLSEEDYKALRKFLNP